MDEKIKDLLRSGFSDLKLLSFELDIPIEQIKQLAREVEAEQSKSTIKTYSANNKANTQELSKLEKMRQKYRALAFGSSKSKKEKPKQLSQQDIELIEGVKAKIKSKIEEMSSLSKSDKKKIAKSILGQLKKIEDYQLTMEQAEELMGLMNSEELKNLNMDEEDRIDFDINSARRKFSAQFVKAISIRLYEVKDIEKLKALAQGITGEMAKQNLALVESVRSEISNRISRIQQQIAMDRLRNDIPLDIKSVITALVNGNIDMQKANAIIDEESRKKVASKPRTRFAMTEEQERRQILLQIRTVIAEKADKFPIQDPEKMILQIQELCNVGLGLSISTVVRNLIRRRDLKVAKDICNKFSGENVQDEVKAYIRILKNEIRNAEISDIVLHGINMQGLPEEDEIYYKRIQRELNIGDVKLGSIYLGESTDGLRKITLADIWPDQIQKGK